MSPAARERPGRLARLSHFGKYVILRRSGHNWVKAKPPNLGGRCRNLSSLAATSAKTPWPSGAVQAKGIQQAPDLELDVGMTSVATVGPNIAWGLRADQAILYWAGGAWTAGPAILK
jgi:hypothetical protein